MRFSPVNGTTSAMVPRAVRAVNSMRRARYWSETFSVPQTFWAMAQASLKATPAPQRSGLG